MTTICTKEITDLFDFTTSSTDIDQICDVLCQLRPDRLSQQALIQLVRHVEKNTSKRQLGFAHYNIFGTGGDYFKTLNISTMASIIASNFLTIYKVGTKAVTSQWGSSDFIDALYSNLQMLPTWARYKAVYKNGSGYVSLNKLGYPYSDHLRSARIILYNSRIPDIYKVIFPSSNLTCSSGQVNGIYCPEYIPFFINILSALERNAILIHSLWGVDELMPGRNLVIRLFHGKITETEVNISSCGLNNKFKDFIAESSDINVHLSKYIDILSGNCPKAVTETLAYNVACILNLRDEDLRLDFFAEKLMSFISCNSQSFTVNDL